MEEDFWEPSRAQVWRRDIVEAAIARARDEVGRVGPARAMAAPRRARGAAASSLRGELARFALAAASLEATAREGPSQLARVRALHDEATRCLRRVGIGRRGSRLSDLHDMLEGIARSATPTAVAPWELDDDGIAADPTRRLFDAGAEVSLRVLETSLGHGSTTRDRAEVCLAGVRAARLSGDFERAQTWLDRWPSTRLRDERIWEAACTRAMAEGGPTELLRAIRAGAIEKTAARMLELSLWTRAARARTLIDELPAPSSSKKTAGGQGDAIAWQVAIALERAHKASLPLASRVASVLRAADAADQIADPALLLLAVAACARWLLRFKQGKEGARIAARYRALCLSISDGRSDDVFALALDGAGGLSAPEPAYEGASVTRLGFELLKARLRGAGSPDESTAEYVEILAHHLSALKGPLMKLGQVLAFYGVPMPEESRELLARLHDEAAPLPFDLVRGVLESELGRKVDDLFAEIDEVPLSAASVGQVHRGVLKTGEEVALKVQYPGIAKRMARDFRAVQLMLPIAQSAFPRWDMSGIVDELRTRMVLECDYRHEARWQSEFAARFADDREIVIPKVHEELSTQRVLTSRFFEGQTFSEFVRAAPESRRRRAGEALLRYAIRSTIVDRSINTDMHPGNLLFSEDQVCVLDFGNVRTWEAEAAWGWREILAGALTADRARVLAGHKLLGFVPGGSERTYEKMVDVLTSFLSSVIGDDTPRRITKDALLGELAPLAPSGPLVADGLAIPPEFAYAFRMYWGLLAILADLDTEIAFRSVSLDALGISLDGPSRRALQLRS